MKSQTVFQLLHTHWRLAVLPAFALLLGACQPTSLPQLYMPWRYADLRALSPANGPAASLDLLAVYTRARGPEWQVRLDLLDISDQSDYDLYLALDAAPGGTNDLPLDTRAGVEWDTLLVVPASGSILALDAHMQPRPGMGLLVVRDPTQDTVIISFNHAVLPETASGFRLQVFLTPAGSTHVADSIGPVRSDGTPPPPAPVLFAFWNTLPAYSPVQALRRWDGAHTGPLGGRHGLYNLLRAVRNTGTPVVLLDLKVPASLSALDYLKGTSLVHDLTMRNLLVLPDNLPGYPGSPAPLPEWVLQRAANDSRQTALKIGLPASQFLFAPGGLSDSGTLPSARVVFAPLPPGNPASDQPLVLVSLQRWGDRLVVPIPGYASPGQSPPQATLDGPSLDVRRSLVQAALSAGSQVSSLLVLGGDLPASNWGNPQIARTTLQYLAAHPWVQPLSADELLAAHPTGPATFLRDMGHPALTTRETTLLDELRQAPGNPAGQAAWEAYLALFNPAFPTPPELPELRASYLGQVGSLLAAARWAGNPASQASCAVDPDGDGQPECILASQDFFGLFELEGGSLAYAFARIPGDEGRPDAIHQLVAPSSQFISGLSEPSTWKLGDDLASDPAVIPGAFTSQPSLSQAAPRFLASLQPGGLKLASPDGRLEKTFRLVSGGLEVSYHSSQPQSVQVYLALDPWLRFMPDWADLYQSSLSSGDLWTWQTRQAASSPAGLATVSSPEFPTIDLTLQGPSGLQARTFKTSRQYLGTPEDPNRDYPPGHYLPFPLALVEMHATGDFTIKLNWSGE